MVKSFRNLFTERGEESEGEGGDGVIEDEATTVEETTFAEHWGWIATVDELASGDRTKWEYYLNMNIVEFFNEMAYRKDRREQTNKEIIKLTKGKTAEEAQILLLSYLISRR